MPNKKQFRRTQDSKKKDNQLIENNIPAQDDLDNRTLPVILAGTFDIQFSGTDMQSDWITNQPPEVAGNTSFISFRNVHFLQSPTNLQHPAETETHLGAVVPTSNFIYISNNFDFPFVLASITSNITAKITNIDEKLFVIEESTEQPSSPQTAPLAPPPTEKILSWAEKIDSLLGKMPNEYQEFMKELAGFSHGSRDAMANRLAPILNDKIRAMPHETLEQKKELARWVNDQLEPLGLAVQCPNTGLPGKLWGIKGSYRPGKDGSFCIEVRKNGKNVKTAQFDALLELSLTDVTPRQQTEKDWQQSIGPKENRSGRKIT